jgi:hypothetical protein
MKPKRLRLSLDLDVQTHSRLRRLVRRMNASSITEVIRRISEKAEHDEILKEAVRHSQ